MGLSPLVSVGAAGKPVSQKLDDRLELDGLEEVIVTFRRREQVTLLERFDLPDGYYAFEVLPMAYTRASADQIQRLAQRQAVRRITPNYELEYFNDEARESTGAEAVAEDFGYDGRNAHVAVVDTGIGAPHPDHRVNVVNNYEQVNPLDRNTMWVDVGPVDTDGNGHGTHVSGTVAGDGSAAPEYRGMAPRADLTVYSTGAALLILNALGAFDHLLAEKRAGRTDVQAVNNSFGPVGGNDVDWDPDDPQHVATYHLYRAGILPVFAAGNCGPDGSLDCLGDTPFGRTGDNTQSNPSQAPWNLSVAATDYEGNVTGFSSRGRPEDYDGLVNYDRETALANYEEYRRALRPPGDDDETAGVHAIEDSGVQLPLTAEVETEVEQFTLEAAPETDLSDVDGYFVEATLTWEPSTSRGVPEVSEFQFRLEGPDGETVASDGSTFFDNVRNDARLTIERWLPLPDDEATYTLYLSSSRGGGQYDVTGDVLAVDAADDSVPEPERPYSLYRPSVGAPGADLWSTVMPTDQLSVTAPDDGEVFYTQLSGTSMASPVVAGVVALLNDAHYREYGEYPAVLDVIDAIESTAEFDEEQGHTVHNIGRGFVDAEAAVEALLETSDQDDEETDDDGPGQGPPVDTPGRGPGGRGE